MTAEELLQTEIPGKWTELVRGQLRVSEPPGAVHGLVAGRLIVRVGQHAFVNELGEVFGQDTGFHIASKPDTVRAPDLAFVSSERMPAARVRGYANIAPDLIVEILSPGDRPADVLEKVADWLRAGVRLAWVVDPDRGTARAHRADGSIALVPKDGSLEGEDVLPGFSCRLADLFA